MNFTMHQLLNKITLSLSLLLSVVVWTGCEIVNPDETTPAFVHIDSFQFQGNPALGTSSQKITSVWAYLNNVPLGAYELPATIPVVTSSAGKLTLLPSITYSGLQEFETMYPFFVSDTATIQPGARVTLTPKTSYFGDSLLNYWIADFDVANKFIRLEGDTDIARVTDPSMVFEGAGSGYIHLKSPQTTTTVIANEAFTARGDAYLELNYKCSVPFVVGIATFDKDNQDVVKYLFGFNPRDTWNKVYVGLSSITDAYPNKPYFVFIKADLEGKSEGYVLLDNIKSISLK